MASQWRGTTTLTDVYTHNIQNAFSQCECGFLCTFLKSTWRKRKSIWKIAWFPGKMCLCVAALVELFINSRWFYPPPPTFWQPSLLDLHHARYSPGTDSWSTDVAPLSSPRSGVCLVAMDGYLYAIGGHDGITAMNTVERYCSMSAPKDHYLTELIASLVLYSLGTN